MLLSQLIAQALISKEIPEEPHFLPQFTPGRHTYQGELPLNLRHLFLLIEFLRNEKRDEDLNFLCIFFGREVARHLHLPLPLTFEICTGFKICTVSEKSVTQTVFTRFVKDMEPF